MCTLISSSFSSGAYFTTSYITTFPLHVSRYLFLGPPILLYSFIAILTSLVPIHSRYTVISKSSSFRIYVKLYCTLFLYQLPAVYHVSFFLLVLLLRYKHKSCIIYKHGMYIFNRNCFRDESRFPTTLFVLSFESSLCLAWLLVIIKVLPYICNFLFCFVSEIFIFSIETVNASNKSVFAFDI